MNRWTSGWLCASVLLAGTAHAATTVAIDSGRLGGTESDGVMTFKGIPYAAPPVGGNRWRAPQPVEPWKDVRPADKYGALCKQIVNTKDNGVGPPPDSEDC